MALSAPAVGDIVKYVEADWVNPVDALVTAVQSDSGQFLICLAYVNTVTGHEHDHPLGFPVVHKSEVAGNDVTVWPEEMDPADPPRWTTALLLRFSGADAETQVISVHHNGILLATWTAPDHLTAIYVPKNALLDFSTTLAGGKKVTWTSAANAHIADHPNSNPVTFLIDVATPDMVGTVSDV
jgi:hypothetical protein